MKIRKRILGYVIDLFISIAICIALSISTFIKGRVIGWSNGSGNLLIK